MPDFETTDESGCQLLDVAIHGFDNSTTRVVGQGLRPDADQSAPWRNFVSTGRVFLGPSTAIIDAAFLLDPTHISGCQAVIFRCVFPCGLKAMLRDGGTHLLALTGIRAILRVTLCREQRDEGYD
jgi:hypothetical protein